ncbi:MAG: hypothetical protein V4631_17520 [Pseudomonadota bacterium]
MNKMIFMALGLLALSGTLHAEGGKMTGVRQQVQVESKDGKVVVQISVENGSGKPVFVPKAVFQDKELFGRTFELTDKASGAEVDYIGPMVKRGPYTKADYVAVKPGATRSNKIDITRSYAFKPGTHVYQLAYAGNYLADVAMLDAGKPAAAAPVTFSHTGK